MPELVAVALPGEAFVAATDAAWADGDAVLPIDPRLPEPAVAQLLEAMAPARLVAADGSEVALDGARPVEAGDALVVPTSGSTGVPKGVVHTHASLEASARATSRYLEVDPAHDRWLCCLPLSHVAGLAVVVRARTLGVPLEVHPRFDAAEVEAAARRGATLTALVPTTLARIDPSLFRRIVVGGAAPPADLPPNCHATYGLTESAGGVVYDGWPIDGVEVRVVEGEVHLRGPMLLRAYRDGSSPVDADGWLHTGDEGELGPDGRLHVHGRRGDVIVTGGEKVWPATVERVLATHPDVAEVAVVGRPDEAWGQAVSAVVVPVDPAAPPSLEELRVHVKAQLPPWAAPHRLELVEALPRTVLGKVRRRALDG